MGIRKLIGQALRKLSARLLPLIAYFSLVFGRTRRTSTDPGQVIEIRDRGSDVTIVSFAGIAALHGGMVNFEFTELLRKLAWEPNVVFVRDPLCACYHLKPDGTPGGLEYYAAHVREAIEQTGARHVVALGTSIGGMAAITFATRLGLDQAIAFSPTWPPERYFLERGPRAALRRFLTLFRAPAVFFERLLLAQMARVSFRRLRRAVGKANVLDLEGELARTPRERLPSITMFHGAGCVPDVKTAEALHRITGAEIVSLPTAMHNSSAYLKRTGELMPAVLLRVEARMRDRGLLRAESTPPPVEAPEPTAVAS